jgi:hypothetical protein
VPGGENNDFLAIILKMNRPTCLTETHTRRLEHKYILEILSLRGMPIEKRSETLYLTLFYF